MLLEFNGVPRQSERSSSLVERQFGAISIGWNIVNFHLPLNSVIKNMGLPLLKVIMATDVLAFRSIADHTNLVFQTVQQIVTWVIRLPFLFDIWMMKITMIIW